MGNLSYDLTDQDVIDHFSQVGPVKHVRCAPGGSSSRRVATCGRPPARLERQQPAGSPFLPGPTHCRRDCRRLVAERETGKPRGFGFVEFFDTPTAESAIRNLSGKDFKGRPVRCRQRGAG